jgi:response regulator RpfG family c-di-GMP phosphodiesterase
LIKDLDIVLVDDEIVNSILLEELMNQDGYLNYKIFTEPLEALAFAKNHNVDALVTDYNMPHLNGIELFSEMKKLHPDMASIMITANNDTEIMNEALNQGITEFIVKPIFPVTFKLRLHNILKIQASLKLSKSFNDILNEKVEEATAALAQSEHEALDVLSKAAEYKDPETASHIARVSHYSRLLARELGFDKDEQELVFYAAPLHDIGKIGVADNILLKPGKLTDEEFHAMQLHSEIGKNILKNNQNIYLNAGEIIAYTHHEKYNGKGYPQGLKGEDIPLYGRIVAIADVFDALTSHRPYKEAWSFEKAVAFMEEQKCQHFDPNLVDIFLASIDEVREIYEKFKCEVEA